MSYEFLKKTAQILVREGHGILAADESVETAGKRLVAVGVKSTEETRRQYRDLFLTTPGIGKYLSGVIFFDETMRQKADDGRTFIDVLKSEGVLSGIKVDDGSHEFDGHPGEKITKGLEGLAERLKEYVAMGAVFTKWRSVITIGSGIPSDACIEENAKGLAAYACMAQEAGLVPIVEPEVLLLGGHSQARAEEVIETTLNAVFRHMKNVDVYLPGAILKSSMVVPGSASGEVMVPEKVAEATLRCFMKSIPKELGGIVFLSGGETDEQATENLNAIAQLAKQEGAQWPLTFSYARALQGAALRTWAGKKENIPLAQEVFLQRLQETVAASRGVYKK